MARRSPTVVNQTCETGCTWRMFGIFNFREGLFSRRLVSHGRHLNTDATGNGRSRHSSDVLGKVDEKYPHVGISSRSRRDYGCKSISCVENAHIADQGNKVTKMTIDQKFVNRNYQGKEGVGCQHEQLLDALQILYSNKELFVNLLQDPNSLLVKQIYDLQSSQVKDSYQAMEKRMMTRLNKHQNSNARQCGKPLKSFDRSDSSSSCEPQFSNKIVVLKPCTNNVKNFADARFDSPWPHSHRSFIHNAQYTKPSHLPLGRIKRKLRYVMRVRRKEQQWRKELEIAERDSPTNGQASIGKRLNSSLDLKDSESCMGKEVASFDESCSRITSNGSVSPSEENTFNLHGESRRSQSNIEGFKAQSLRKNHRTKLGLQKEVENGSYSTLSQKIKDAPRDTVNIFSDKLQPFGPDISFRESLTGANLHAHYDIPKDAYKDSPTQNFDKNSSPGGLESFQDSHPEIHSLSSSPEVASSSLSSCERTEDDTINMINRFELPITETDAGYFTGENSIDPPATTTFQPDELPVQVVHETFEENNLADLFRSSLDPTNNLASSSKDNLDCLREILQVFTLKWDELVVKCESSHHLRDESTFDELKGSIGQLSCDANLLDCVVETFMEAYQNCCFPLHIARKSPKVQSYVAKKVLANEISELINLHSLPHLSQITLEQIVGKDLSRSGSWLNIQVDTEDIVIEVEEDVLENLVLEIVYEMDMKA